MQPTTIIDDPDIIEAELARFTNQIAADFDQQPRHGKDVDRFANLRAGYFLEIASRGSWKMIRLCGPAFKGNSDKLLDIVVHSPNSGIDRVAGRLVIIDDKVELLHDGRVTKRDERSGPFLCGPENVFDIDDRQFFRLGPLEGELTLDRLIHYHESRLSLNVSPTVIPENAYKGDPGAVGGGFRSTATWEAKHSFLYEAFVNWFGKTNPLPTPRCRPDCWFEKDGKTTLVEIKPDSGLQSIVTGVGQLMLYGSICGDVHRRLLVCPPISERSFRSDIMQLLLKNRIELIEARFDGEQYDFWESRI